MRDESFDPRPDPAANPPERAAPGETADRPKSGVFGFGASATAYFVIVVVLAVIFLGVIFILQR